MDHGELIDVYVSGIDSIIPALSGLSPEQLRARPVAGSWSILENVCHLADSEALFAERMKRVLSENRPAMLVSNPDDCVATLAYHEREAAEEIALMELLRRQIGHILVTLPEEAWQRVGIHSVDGEKTLEQLVQKAVDHLEHHLKFMRDKRQMIEGNA